MSDEGEKTCPLCAEEMDLTDQQLKPCRCGYEVCVWCWHHIMEMAEKDESEGRCPACRTPYDKDKIVGTAAKCGRLVAEVSMEKKKSQKAKTKTTAEGRKQLSSVRVIQRNLVYIVGLPLNLADEDLLQHKEYFGQYGKVLKVSISRTSGGDIQQFTNNTCSVYITYGKEDEAVRCIQSIHGFNLDGRSLRACFGTTKYCHAWLRNVPCTNPDCLYLHDIGSQDDSFSKDEIISAYSRVQQITGIENNSQRRAGSVLPPPADGYCIDSSATTGKPVVKSTSNNIVSNAKVSPPSSSAGRTGALPAAASWASRGSSCQLSAGVIVSSNGPAKQKPDAASSSLPISVQSTDLGKKVILNDDIYPKEPKNKTKPSESKKLFTTDLRSNMSVGSDTSSDTHAGAPMSTDRQSSPSLSRDNNTINLAEQSNIMETEQRSLATAEKNLKLHPDVTAISLEKQISSKNSGVLRPNGLSLDCFLVQRDLGLEQSSDAKFCKLASPASKVLTPKEDDFEVQRLSDAIVTQTSCPSSSHSFNILNHLRGPLHQQNVGFASRTVNPVVNRQGEEHLDAISSNGFVNNQVRPSSEFDHSYAHGKHMGIFDNGAASNDYNYGPDMMESSIISDILSLDLDSWDDSVASSQNFGKLLGGNEIQQSSFNLSSSWKAQNSNQSRFSFARQEESHEPSFNSAINTHSFSPSLVQNREAYLDRLGSGYGAPQHNAEHYDGFGSSQSVLSTNKLSVPRAQISAPPGFSVPNRPPPGFSSHVRNDQTFDMKSGNHFHDNASFFRNPYQASQSSNSNNIADIEFIDPAILAVGKGRPPSSSFGNSNLDMGYTSQASDFENDSRLQFLMQRSLQPHQNLRYGDVGENYSPHNAYGYNSRRMEASQQIGGMSSFSQYSQQQQQQPRPRAAMSNGHWDNWSDVMAGNNNNNNNNMGMADLVRNDRLNFNKLYGGYEESKFQMPGANDLYNRTFGM